MWSSFFTYFFFCYSVVFSQETTMGLPSCRCFFIVCMLKIKAFGIQGEYTFAGFSLFYVFFCCSLSLLLDGFAHSLSLLDDECVCVCVCFRKWDDNNATTVNNRADYTQLLKFGECICARCVYSFSLRPLVMCVCECFELYNKKWINFHYSHIHLRQWINLTLHSSCVRCHVHSVNLSLGKCTWINWFHLLFTSIIITTIIIISMYANGTMWLNTVWNHHIKCHVKCSYAFASNRFLFIILI